MRQTLNEKNQRSFSRRAITQLSLTALAACFVPAATALANGGGGRGGDSADKSNDTNYKPAIKDRYTQKEFVQLSKNELKALHDKYIFYRTGKLHISGFSDNMTTYIMLTILFRRRAIFRLIRDMGKLKTTKARLARLKQEEISAKKTLEKLKRSLKRAKKLKLKAAIDETEHRIYISNEYLKFVEIWQKYPSEGTH